MPLSEDEDDNVEEIPRPLSYLELKMLGKRKYSSAVAASKKARATRTRRRTITAMLLSREPKFVETAVNTLSLTNVAQIFNLNEIGQGDNYMNRQGNVIQAKYLQFRYSCNMTNQTIVQCANFKFAIVLDRNPQGTPPTFSTIFDSSVSTNCFAMKNLAFNQDRFVILHEHIGVATGNTGGEASQSCAKGYINLGRLKVEDQVVRYPGTIPSVPNTNGLFLVIVSTSTVANDVRFLGTFRYVFNEQ